MCNIRLDSKVSEKERRDSVHRGDIHLFSSRPSVQSLVDFARELVYDAFHPYDPIQAQFSMAVEDFAALLAEFKPRFMHHATAKELIQNILVDFGCDLDQTYFDVPRMRTVPDGDYLRSGIAYAVPPHRDTWYAGSQAQLNWWLPVCGVTAENTMMFHPQYWNRPVENASDSYNHEEWLRSSRLQAAQHVKQDTRRHPRMLEEIDDDADFRFDCREGSLLLFSASHLHSTSPNNSGQTRFSVDFRTVHLQDLQKGTGAPNVDNNAVGTTLGEYMRASDFSPLPEDVVSANDRPKPASLV
jgi:hypothetical protein